MSFVSMLVLATLLATVSTAHELPDNRVEVGLDAVMMSTKIEISYSVAMNDATMLKIEPSLSDANSDADNPKIENEDLVRQFGPLALPKIGKEISVLANEKELVLEPVRWEVSARHPVRFICYYNIDLTGVVISDETKLQIEDRNYRDLEKEIAVALRAKQAASLISSDAAILLVRAKRNRIWELDSQAQSSAQSIQARVSLPHDRPANKAAGNTTPSETPRSQSTEQSDSFVPPISLLVGFCVIAIIIVGAIFVLVRR